MTGLCVTMIIGLVNFFENQPVIAIVILSIAFFANAFQIWVGWSGVMLFPEIFSAPWADF
jgi:hypothetical protein